MRAAAVVDAVTSSGSTGARLVDIVEVTGLQKTTAHRVIATLLELGWLEQDTQTNAFHLGDPLVAFGTAALNRHGLLDLANPYLMRIAERTEDTVYLSIRSGSEALCVDRVTGSFPIRTLTLRIGDRRPLGVGAGSMALLAWLPEVERSRILQISTSNVGASSIDVGMGVARTRERGFAINHGGVVPGAKGVGVPVLSRDGRAVASLSVAAVEQRLSDERVQEVADLLVHEAATLAETIDSMTGMLSEAGVRHLLGHGAS